MKTALRFLLVLVTCIPVGETLALDAYLVRFAANGRGGVAVGGNVLWRDDILFFNTNTVPVQVKLLSISHGSIAVGTPSELTIPARGSASVDKEIAGGWQPTNFQGGLWIVHLDIPAGVVVESRNEYYFFYTGTFVPPRPLGKVSMPIFRELAPAGKEQVHLGTDLSANRSRANVGIYNAGSETATAVIAVRRTCDDLLVESRTVTIAPDTIIQIDGFQASGTGCLVNNTSSWARYTTVTVSQPSLTFVSNLTEEKLPPVGEGIAPAVGLAVTKSQTF